MLIETPSFDAVEDPVERAVRSHAFDWRGLEREAAAKAETLTIRQAFNRTIVLQTGLLEQPLEALNQCIDDLMTHWDIDLEAHRTLTRPAVPINLREVPGMVSYPPKMLRKNMPGMVNIRLAIDDTGRISGCHIQMPLSDPAFEESSCADVQHALEFLPALDEDGRPIPSYWVTSVVFHTSP